MTGRPPEFQRNAAFVAFTLVICQAGVVYLAGKLQSVVIPLIWSAFFAVPVTGLVDRIDHATNVAARKIWRRCRSMGRSSPGEVPLRRTATGPADTWVFATEPGLGYIKLGAGAAAEQFVALATRSWLSCLFPDARWCPRRPCRIRITKLEVRQRVNGARVTTACQGPEVNRLVEGWSYYVDVEMPEEEGPMGMRQPLQASGTRVHLYLDKEQQYPAVIPTGGAARAAEFAGDAGAEEDAAESASSTVSLARSWHAAAAAERPPEGRLVGAFEIDTSSSITWCFALLVTLIIMTLGCWVLVQFVYYGVFAFKNNLDRYQNGVLEFSNEVQDMLHNVVSKEAWDEIQRNVQNFVKDALPNMASDLVSYLEGIGWQIILFLVYIFFWIFEPLPMNSSVAQVFTSYLYLKTLVCILFASLMSALLFALGCPIWHLFFVITFFLNYIPEVGAMLSAALTVPAVLFDGHYSITDRMYHLAWLVVCGLLIKIITGNIIEVRAYATRGGQFMRMHPVILMALMMFCSALLGLTGMFLAIPIVAAVKYYMITANMPGVLLNPMLVMIEGDEHGPHKNFVDRHRSLIVEMPPLSLSTATTPSVGGCGGMNASHFHDPDESEAERPFPAMPQRPHGAGSQVLEMA